MQTIFSLYLREPIEKEQKRRERTVQRGRNIIGEREGIKIDLFPDFS